MINPKFYEERPENSEMVLKIQRNRNNMFAEGIDTPLTDEFVDICLNKLQQYSDITLSKKTMMIVLKIYPKVFIEYLNFGQEDTEVVSQIHGAVTQFFLNCNYPTYGDKCNIEFFNDLLKKEISIFESKHA